MLSRLPIVGVMGSGSSPHTERATALGRWLANRGVHLLTGGGGGVMAAVSRAFHETSPRRGLVIGVLPCEENASRPPPGYPNPWVEIAIATHLPYSGELGRDPLSRNHINVLTSHVIVALPGAAGTASEVALAHSYGRPVVAFLGVRTDLPELPEGVPVHDDIDRIRDFVDARLDGLHPGPG